MKRREGRKTKRGTNQYPRISIRTLNPIWLLSQLHPGQAQETYDLCSLMGSCTQKGSTFGLVLCSCCLKNPNFFPSQFLNKELCIFILLRAPQITYPVLAQPLPLEGVSFLVLLDPQFGPFTQETPRTTVLKGST